jgi:hypothetical protein
VTSVTNLDLLPFVNDAVSRGSLDPSWWLIDVEFGFEIWMGGQGLAVSDFSASAAAGSSGGGGSCGGSTCNQAPSAPSGLSATTASSSVINLTWTPDIAPANCAITGYNVYRSTQSGFTPSNSNLVASAVTANSYSDTALAASTTYYYVVEAVDSAGISAPSAQASATTSSSGGGGGIGFACHVLYTPSWQNSNGFGAMITINNTGTVALSNWNLTWTFSNGQRITQLWNGAETQNGANVTVSNLSYNGSIPAGGSYNGIGFNGSWNGSSNSVPTNFAINGVACK